MKKLEEKNIEINVNNFATIADNPFFNELDTLIDEIKITKHESTESLDDYKIICGLKPYCNNAVKNNKLYKNGIAFITKVTNYTVPSSLLRIYSLFFKSTDMAVAFIYKLVRNELNHEDFAKYLYCRHKIKLINFYGNPKGSVSKLNSNDFKHAKEVLFIGIETYDKFKNKFSNIKFPKAGYIVHPSGRNHNHEDYFATWYLYCDGCIKKTDFSQNVISFDDFCILKQSK